MTRKQLRNNLHQLNDVRGNINPRAAFVHETRTHLLSTLGHTVTPRKTAWLSFAQLWQLLSIIMPTRTVYAFVRPAVIVFGVFVVATGSWITGAFASLNSVPGDVLYPVKLGIEKTTEAVVGVTQGRTAQTTLQVEYASRRLDEATKVLQTADSEHKHKRAQQAFERFTEGVGHVNDTLDALKKEDTVAAVQIAKVLDKNSERYLQQIDETKRALAHVQNADGVKDVVSHAEMAVVTSETKSVEVYIESLAQAITTSTPSTISKEEVAQSVDRKLQKIESRLTDATKQVEGAVKTVEKTPLPPSMVVEKSEKVIAPAMQVQRKTEEAREKVAQVKQLLEGENLAEAAQKVGEIAPISVEVNDQAHAVQKTAEQVDEAVRNTMKPETSTTTPTTTSTPK